MLKGVFIDLDALIKMDSKAWVVDKKNANQDFVTIARGQSVRKTINLVLLKQIGRAFNTSIEAQDIYNYLTNDYPSNANI